jgi:hypothetical protein
MGLGLNRENGTMTRRERLERKLEKRADWAQSRKAKAEQAFDRADLREERSGIPLGQPILVGHHSEGRHRRALERADNAMRKAIEHNDMAKHHESKAEGLAAQLDGSIYDDDPDAIEQLEARIAAREAKRKLNNAINRIIRAAPRGEISDEKIGQLQALGMSEATARKVFEKDCMGCIGIPAYKNANLGGNIKRDRDRIKRIKARRARAEQAEQAGGVLIRSAGGYSQVTFAEKPDREVINALKAAGYHWGGGCWSGPTSKMPDCISA